MRAGLLGGVITGDPVLAKAFSQAQRTLPQQLNQLESHVQDNPEQAGRARSIRATGLSYLSWASEVEQLFEGRGWEQALARVKSGHGSERFGKFTQTVSAFLEEEDRLALERGETLAESQRHLNTLLALGVVLTVVGSLGVGVIFDRRFARRFAAVEATVRQLRAGEAVPTPLDGNDELAGLDRAFRGLVADLIRSSNQVRDLYDYAPCGYHSVDDSGFVVAMNQTELRWLGYHSAEVLGRLRGVDLVAPAHRDRYWSIFLHVKEQSSISDVEIDLVRKDGTTFSVLLNSSAILDGDGRFLRSRTTLTDLTERKRAESASQLIANVTENLPIGLLIYQLDDTADGAVLRARSANPSAGRILGVPLERCVGMAITDVFPAIPAEQVRRYTAVAVTERSDDLGEFRYGDDQIKPRWWAVQAFALPNRSVGIVFQDVTARRDAEEQVRRLNVDLERRVADRTLELEASNRDLARRSEENEMFVYSVSHDLRSPLVNLQGFSKELEKGCRGLSELLEGAPPAVKDQGRALLEGKVGKAITFIRSAVSRLSTIIDALLRLSRAGRVEYRLERLETADIVARVVEAVQTTAAERGAVITTTDLAMVYGDRTAVEQVFANLVGNALVYLIPGGAGQVVIGCLPAQDPQSPAGFRAFFVRDNGLGIAAAHQKKIFQAFQRAHPGVGSGEGLGLALVSRAIERHGGRIWVESSPGEGSTFYFTLPTEGVSTAVHPSGVR